MGTIRYGKVFSIDYKNGTVDVLMLNGFGIIRGVNMVSPFASTNTGVVEFPVLNSIQQDGGTVKGYADTPNGPMKIEHLYPFETKQPGLSDLDDDTVNTVYAVLLFADETVGKNQPVCVGFLYPNRNQILFDPDDPPSGLLGYVRKAISKFKGAFIHRTNSDVYWTVDADGNMEYAHPNGSFFRMAEFPTQEEDGAIHVPLDKANEKAELRENGKRNGTKTKMGWDVSKKKGSDGKYNKDRKLYAHLEVATEKGTVELDINKKTGNVVIRTPKDSSGASSGSNQLTIIAGGDATIQSVAGDVLVQSVKQTITVQAGQNIDIKTDSKADQSIMLASNASNVDYLPLFTVLMQKFNGHTHVCKGTNKKTDVPDGDHQLKKGDATRVTKAG